MWSGPGVNVCELGKWMHEINVTDLKGQYLSCLIMNAHFFSIAPSRNMRESHYVCMVLFESLR